MLTSEERAGIEKRLLEERERAVGALREFDQNREESLQEGMGELTMYRFHLADIGTEVMEQEKQFLLASVEGRRLVEIDDSLRRLYGDPEGFGLCDRCGRGIGFERLGLVPEAKLCAECQRTVEG